MTVYRQNNVFEIKWNRLTVCKKTKTENKKQKSSGLFKNVIYKMCLEIIYLICIKRILELNNLLWFICLKTQLN